MGTDHDDTEAAGSAQVEEPVLGCEEHAAEPPVWLCPACVAKYGLKMTTPNLKAMMSVGAIRGRFRPGRSGNPSGPGPRESFEALALRLLDEAIPHPDRPGVSMERRELILRSVLARAATGDRTAIKLVLERVWPKRVKHEVDARGRVEVVFDDQDRREMEAADRAGGASDGVSADDET